MGTIDTDVSLSVEAQAIWPDLEENSSEAEAARQSLLDSAHHAIWMLIILARYLAAQGILVDGSQTLPVQRDAMGSLYLAPSPH